MNENTPQEDAWNSTPQKLERWYNLYLAFTKKSQQARLEVSQNPSNRASIKKELPMSLEEFEHTVNRMDAEPRIGYLHKLEMGYEAALFMFRGSKAYKFLRGFLPDDDAPHGRRL